MTLHPDDSVQNEQLEDEQQIASEQQSEMVMSRRALGSSDLILSPIGLGCWQFSQGVGLIGRYWPTLDNQEITEMVKTSLDGGINWFDTAEIYGNGTSESALAKSLIELDVHEDDAIIATKWWPLFRSARHIGKSIDQRQVSLAGRRIDLYQIHQPYSLSSTRKQMNEMAKLAERGLIRYVGVSNFSAKAMREADKALRAHGMRLVSNQVKYSLLDRRIEHNGILETAQELGIAIIAYSPLEQGILSGKFHKDSEQPTTSVSGPRKWMSKFRDKGLEKSMPLIDLLEHLSQKYDATPSQIALNWVINAHGETVFAIPGASKIKQVADNIGTMKFQLTPGELQALGDLSIRVNTNT
jgi:aryl-alcohol dehydrogenase-like predicted oxidoreductase